SPGSTGGNPEWLRLLATRAGRQQPRATAGTDGTVSAELGWRAAHDSCRPLSRPATDRPVAQPSQSGPGADFRGPDYCPEIPVVHGDGHGGSVGWCRVNAGRSPATVQRAGATARQPG